MADERDDQSGGVNISGGNVTAGGDIVGGDKMTVGNVGAGANLAMGRAAGVSVSSGDMSGSLAEWQAHMSTRIDSHASLGPDEKKDLQEQIVKIQTEAGKGLQANVGRLERLINSIGALAPDIFDFTLASFKDSLSGLGLVANKTGDKVRLQRKS